MDDSNTSQPIRCTRFSPLQFVGDRGSCWKKHGILGTREENYWWPADSPYVHWYTQKIIEKSAEFWLIAIFFGDIQAETPLFNTSWNRFHARYLFDPVNNHYNFPEQHHHCDDFHHHDRRVNSRWRLWVPLGYTNNEMWKTTGWNMIINAGWWFGTF